MFGISHVPRQVKPFFRPLRRFFLKRQWQYFCWLVLAMAASEGLKTVAGLAGAVLGDVYPQRFLDFINESPWSPGPILQHAAMQVLKGLGWRKGMPLDVIFDGTKFRKRGKKMEGAHRFFDTVWKTAGWGHEAVVLCLRFRGVTLPWAIRLYLPKEYVRKQNPGRGGMKHHRTTNQIAAEMLDGLPAKFLAGGRATALFDSGFLNTEVLAACRRRRLRFISVAQVTRVFRPHHKRGRPGPGKGKNSKNKRQIGSYGPGVLRYEGDEIELPSYRGTTRYRVAERIGAMQKVGWVKVVFSRRLSDNGTVALVTNDVSLTAADVIARYRSRWHIEVFFKTVKQLLGFGDFRTRRTKSVERHLHLSALAYLLLKYLGLRRPGEASPMTADAALHSTEALQRQLRSIIAQDHLDAVTNLHGPVTAIRSLKARMTGLKKTGT